MSKEPSLPREPAKAESSPEPSPLSAPLCPPAAPITEPIPSAPLAASGEDDAGEEVARCDVCEVALPDAEDDDEDAGGHGLYVWVRHGQVVYEEPPLCAACASAITLSALRRWDLEEEEG